LSDPNPFVTVNETVYDPATKKDIPGFCCVDEELDGPVKSHCHEIGFPVLKSVNSTDSPIHTVVSVTVKDATGVHVGLATVVLPVVTQVFASVIVQV
jgi:hypothetical protein